MKLHISLDKDFEEKFKELKRDLPKELFDIEGLTEEKLDPTRFFKSFIHSDNVANASIDDNANVNDKNINTLLSESHKPFDTLLCLNKAYIELKENYGKDSADKFLEMQIKGDIYTHDLNSLSYKPYSYFGKETILINYKNQLHYISFEDLYDLVEENPTLLNEKDMAYCKYTKDLKVYDEGSKWTTVSRVIRKKRNTNFNFIKCTNGCSQIVTSNHPIITTKGDVNASDVKTDRYVKTELPNVSFGDIKYVYLSDYLEHEEGFLIDGRPFSEERKENGMVSLKNHQSIFKNKLDLTKDFGWLYGLILAEGSQTKTTIYIHQNDGRILEKAENILKDLYIPYSIQYRNKNVRLEVRSLVFRLLLKNLFEYKKNNSINKKLPSDFLKFNKDFLLGVVGGLLDGDGTLNCNSKRNISIRISSRTLLNQISFVIQLLGYNVRDYLPVEALEVKIREHSFTQKNTLFGISFTPQLNEEMFDSIKITQRDIDYKTREDTEKYFGQRYIFGYGKARVVNNKELALEKENYVYDISTETEQFIQNNIVSHNCYNYSLKPIAKKGLFFISEMQAKPPKHLCSFNMQVLQFISYACNQQAGAVGLSDYLLYSFYFWKKDIDSGYIHDSQKDIIKIQEFQSMIYNLNQPFMKVNQSAYTNFTIIDREYFIGLFGGGEFPDGSYMIDYIEEFMQYQKDWMKFIREEREKKSFTFPVITSSRVWDKENKKFKDEDMAKEVVRHNMKWGDINMYNSTSTDVLSSCCFDKNTLVDVCYGNDQITDTLENIYNKYVDSTELHIKTKGNYYKKGKVIRVPLDDKKMYTLITKNGSNIIATEDHLFPVYRVEVVTENFKKEHLDLMSVSDLSKKLHRNPHITYKLLAYNHENKDNVDYISISSIQLIPCYDASYVYCFEMEEDPYFILHDENIETHNCRLTNDITAFEDKKLEGNFNSTGGSDLSIGSTKVVTINLPRVAYKSLGDFEKSKEILKEIIENIHKVLKVHRNILEKNIKRGLLPLYTHGLIDLNRQFGTVGITGLMEFVKEMGGINETPAGLAYNEKGLKIAEDLLNYINELNEVTIKKYGFTANMEQIPGESATIKLVKKDKLFYSDKVKTDIYSNQWIALSAPASFISRVNVSSVLDGKCGGGQILHNNLAEPYPDFETAWNMDNFLAKKGVIYYSDIRKFQYCKNDHNFFGTTCPICGKKSEGDIIKIVGYLVKNRYFKEERKEELKNRKFYSQTEIN